MRLNYDADRPSPFCRVLIFEWFCNNVRTISSFPLVAAKFFVSLLILNIVLDGLLRPFSENSGVFRNHSNVYMEVFCKNS